MKNNTKLKIYTILSIVFILSAVNAYFKGVEFIFWTSLMAATGFFIKSQDIMKDDFE